jgi:type IV pilus assembly protein PilN
MTSINLLPWREWKRQEQKKQFGLWSVISLCLAGVIMLLIHIQMSSKIDYQLSRNNYISSEISKLDKKITDISELQKVRRSLLERMDVIQDLQRSRPSIVHLFTEIIGTVPNGVYLQSLTQNDGDLVISGEAESNSRVSTYMRNLSGSDWLKDPNLTVIQIEDKKVNRISAFTLTVKQASPNAIDEQNESGGVQ